jgi:hypothetical protein
MTDILAILDAAIDALRKGEDFRHSDRGGSEADGTRRIPKPAENLEISSDRSRGRSRGLEGDGTCGSPKPAENLESDRKSRESRAENIGMESIDISPSNECEVKWSEDSRIDTFLTGLTGLTVTIQDSCGFDRSRDGSRKSCRTCRSEQFRHFSAFLHGNFGSSQAPDGGPVAPEGVPHKCWLQFLADGRAFFADGWASQAEALGWAVADLADTMPAVPSPGSISRGCSGC